MSGWEAQSAVSKATVTVTLALALAPTHTVPALLQGCCPPRAKSQQETQDLE